MKCWTVQDDLLFHKLLCVVHCIGWDNNHTQHILGQVQYILTPTPSSLVVYPAENATIENELLTFCWEWRQKRVTPSSSILQHIQYWYWCIQWPRSVLLPQALSLGRHRLHAEIDVKVLSSFIKCNYCVYYIPLLPTHHFPLGIWRQHGVQKV